MKTFINKTILNLSLLLLLFSYVFAQTPIKDILGNPLKYDGKVVTIHGKAMFVKEKTSKAGNFYTTFDLYDGEESITIFTWGHNQVKDGERVEVAGIFKETKRVGKLIFKKQIDANKIKRLK